MHKTKVININLQEGILVSEDDKTVFAFFSHHNTILVLHSPWTDDDIEIPDPVSSYEVSAISADHLTIAGYAKDEEREAHWFKEQNKKLSST